MVEEYLGKSAAGLAPHFFGNDLHPPRMNQMA